MGKRSYGVGGGKIKLSNQNQEILRQIISNIENEAMIIDLLTKVLNLDIREVKECELEQLNSMAEYGFSIVRIELLLYGNKTIEVYLNYSSPEFIKQNIFCFWCMIYEKESKKENENNEKKKSPYITIRKVQIHQIAKEKYKDSILLEIENNTSNILKYGAEIHLVEFENYIKQCKSKYNELEAWESYIEKGSEDILLVGMLPDEFLRINSI